MSWFRSLPAECSILCRSIWDMSRIKWDRNRFLSEYFGSQVDVPASFPLRKSFHYLLHVRMHVFLVSTRVMWRTKLLDFLFFFSTTAPQPFKAYWSRDAPTCLTFSNCELCPRCVYVFCVYLRTNSDLCHLQHKLTGFYNRDLTLYSPVVTTFVFVTEMKSVYSAVRPGSLNKAVCASSLKG